MANNLYPILYKPGIQRDGTQFQREYCSDGQWIRFYRGKAKKIGGMRSLNYTNNAGRYNNINSVFINNGADLINVFFADPIGIYRASMNDDFQITNNIASIFPVGPQPPLRDDPNRLWQFVPITGALNNISLNSIVALGTSNLNNILNTSASTLVNIKLDDLATQVQGLPPEVDASGGILYVNPRLYIYGKNGQVSWSKSNNCFDFTAANNSINISTDKIIFGASIRGGSLSPTLLFWTPSSVIRLINVNSNNDTAAANIELNFKKDVLTKDSSILSSRCVIEYDGTFYWPGTNRFFVYNGVVVHLENNINRRYFFDNIDMNFRQRVFGVKNVGFSEMWWFYPEKLGAPNRPAVPAGTITRALIYNLEENSWYDTQIFRDCGFFDNVTGDMYTLGSSLVAQAVTKYLWKHEVGVNEVIVGGPNRLINSSFTTPTISWAAFNPMKELTGIDRWMELRRIEPDFLTAANSTISVVVNTKEYAQSGEENSELFPFQGNTEKIDMNIQGRHMTFTFSSTDNFEMGHIILLLSIGDGQ